MTKKVAVLYSGAKTWGGVESYLKNLLSEENKEMDFILLSMGDWELTKKLKSISMTFSSKRANPFLIFQLGRFLKNNGIDLIISQGVVSNFYARSSAILFGIPNLCIVHSDIAGEYKNPMIRRLYLISDYILKPFTKKFICVSEYMKTVLISRGVSPEKIKVIYNGIDSSALCRKKKNSNKFIIGSIGRLEKEKGYDILIEAARELPDNIEIHICGEGGERKNLEKMIQKYKLTEKVKLMGFCNDIYKFYSEITLYIQPSRSEGFGLTVIEAMDCGLPVVVSANGALPELVKNGETGIILDDLSVNTVAVAIKKCASEREELTKLAKKAQEVVAQKFNLQNWRKETLKYIGDCIK